MANKVIAAATLIVNPSQYPPWDGGDTVSFVRAVKEIRRTKQVSLPVSTYIARSYIGCTRMDHTVDGLSMQHSLSMVLGVLFSAHRNSMAYKEILC